MLKILQILLEAYKLTYHQLHKKVIQTLINLVVEIYQLQFLSH